MTPQEYAKLKADDPWMTDAQLMTLANPKTQALTAPALPSATQAAASPSAFDNISNGVSSWADTTFNDSYDGLNSQSKAALTAQGIDSQGFDQTGSYGQGVALDYANSQANVSPLESNQYAQADLANAKVADMNSVDWTGLAGLGISAFGAYDTYKNNKERMSLYKDQIDTNNAQIAKRDKVRSSWNSAISNAGK